MTNPMFPDIETVVEEIMYRQGWDVDDNPLEFDASSPDSQISILKDSVTEVFEVLEDLGRLEELPCDECDYSDILIINHECITETEQD